MVSTWEPSCIDPTWLLKVQPKPLPSITQPNSCNLVDSLTFESLLCLRHAVPGNAQLNTTAHCLPSPRDQTGGGLTTEQLHSLPKVWQRGIFQQEVLYILYFSFAPRETSAAMRKDLVVLPCSILSLNLVPSWGCSSALVSNGDLQQTFLFLFLNRYVTRDWCSRKMSGVTACDFFCLYVDISHYCCQHYQWTVFRKRPL